MHVSFFLNRPAQRFVNLIMFGVATLLGVAVFAISPFLTSVLSKNASPLLSQGAVNPAQSQAASLGGWVWYDANADGIQDSTESGLGRVTLDLWLDDGDGRFEPSPALGADTYVKSVVTNNQGRYLFDLPVVGSFFVDVSDINRTLLSLDLTPASMAEPTPIIPVVQDQAQDGVSFGYVLATDPGQAVVGDLVWLDADRNGTHEESEAVIAGVEICAIPIDGAPSLCTTTDAQGRYRLRIPIGGYRIAPTASPLGLVATTPPFLSRFLRPGTQALSTDFGFAGEQNAWGSLGGTVWKDDPVTNASEEAPPNGILDVGETGIPEVSVQAILDTGTGQWNANTPALVALSAGDGRYAFPGVAAGSYLLQVSDDLDRLQNFAVSTLGPTPGVDGQNQSQPFAVSLSAGQIDTLADFGYREYEASGQSPQPGPGTLGDLVWFDHPIDGVYDSATGDLPVAGVTVDLVQGDQFVAAATTDAAGRYLFTGLPLGAYQLSVSDRFRRLDDTEPTTLLSSPSTLEGNHAQPYTFSLGLAGFDHRGADFGFQPAASSYTITQQVSPIGPVRVGERVQFTVRITNTGSTWLTTLPLQYVYNPDYLRLDRATVTPDDSANDGRLDWGDLTDYLGALAPVGLSNRSLSLVITFTVLADTGTLPDWQTVGTALAHTVGADLDGPGGVEELNHPLGTRAAVAGTVIIYPTASILLDYQVTQVDSRSLVTWRTASESDIIGFHLLRMGSDGHWVQLSPALIPAQYSGQPVGGDYQWEAAIEPVHDSYALEILRVDGTVSRQSLGQIPSMNRIFLPYLSAE